MITCPVAWLSSQHDRRQRTTTAKHNSIRHLPALKASDLTIVSMSIGSSHECMMLFIISSVQKSAPALSGIITIREFYCISALLQDRYARGARTVGQPGVRGVVLRLALGQRAQRFEDSRCQHERSRGTAHLRAARRRGVCFYGLRSTKGARVPAWEGSASALSGSQACAV